MDSYEVIIGVEESHDEKFAVAKAALILKGVVSDASIWRVNTYDGGNGVGFNVDTEADLKVDHHEQFESVEPIPVVDI